MYSGLPANQAMYSDARCFMGKVEMGIMELDTLALSDASTESETDQSVHEFPDRVSCVSDFDLIVACEFLSGNMACRQGPTRKARASNIIDAECVRTPFAFYPDYDADADADEDESEFAYSDSECDSDSDDEDFCHGGFPPRTMCCADLPEI